MCRGEGDIGNNSGGILTPHTVVKRGRRTIHNTEVVTRVIRTIVTTHRSDEERRTWTIVTTYTRGEDGKVNNTQHTQEVITGI